VRDIKLKELLKKYLDSGKIYKYQTQPSVFFSLTIIKFEVKKLIKRFKND
jgi:hypothetical protein